MHKANGRRLNIAADRYKVKNVWHMHKELDNVLTKFPLFRARVIELFNNSHEFRSLCEDYLLCRDKLSQVEWESQKIQATGRQVTELSHKLEAEMMKYLRPLHD